MLFIFFCSLQKKLVYNNNLFFQLTVRSLLQKKKKKKPRHVNDALLEWLECVQGCVSIFKKKILFHFCTLFMYSKAC